MCTPPCSLVRSRMKYTGETWSGALSSLSPWPSEPIPQPGLAQQRLESHILSLLLKAATSTPFRAGSSPLGLVRCVPQPQSLCLTMETRDAARALLTAVLPAEESGEIRGVAGLRAEGAGENAVLRSHDGAAQVTLHGFPWEFARPRLIRECLATGAHPLWAHPDMSAAEAREAEQWDAYWTEAPRMGSALLRRIKVFTTVAAPLAISGYGTSERWTLELDYDATASFNATLLAEALTDPVGGLGDIWPQRGFRSPTEQAAGRPIPFSPGPGATSLNYAYHDGRECLISVRFFRR